MLKLVKVIFDPGIGSDEISEEDIVAALEQDEREYIRIDRQEMVEWSQRSALDPDIRDMFKKMLELSDPEADYVEIVNTLD